MKPDNRNKKRSVKRFMKPFHGLAMLLAITALMLSGYNGSTEDQGSSDLWEPLNRSNRSTRNAANVAAIEKRVDDIVDVFRKALPFNPPKGFAVMPRLEYLRPLALPGNSHSPEPVHFRVAFRMPPQSVDIVAGVNVWINDPYNLLGEPVLKDGEGDLFLLPPDVGTKSGQNIVSRMAHPPGYDNEYPCRSIFPLWSDDQEPFLRTVVRPTFGLARSTVTTLFTAGDRPFWKPVSQERWINAMIAAAENLVGEITAGVDAADEINLTEEQANQLRAYIDRLRQSAEEEAIITRYQTLIASSMEMYERFKNYSAEAAEAYLQAVAEYEKMMVYELERAVEWRKEIDEMEAKLLAALTQREDVMQQMRGAIESGNWDRLDELADEHDLDNLRLIADAGRAIGKLRAELSALSPAERRAPAYGFLQPDHHPLGTHRQVVAMVFEAERASGLVPATAEGARAIVAIDHEFFNFSDDGAPIRMMAVEYWGSNTLMYDNNRRNLLDDIWANLDWRALRGMVR